MDSARSIISIRNLSKRFGDSVVAVDNVSIEIAEGEFFALLGPSGCGKTTLLRMLAGFESPSEGAIALDGQDTINVDPNKRPVNMVFQSYAVFPHMSVERNVGYGLRVTGVSAEETRKRVREALALVKMEGYGDRMPSQLSGGQRQRVALARALIKRPKVLLLDEPLSALDAKLREAMQLELVRLQKTVGITFVIVTHDQNEALSMADRIAVMQDGRVRQIAPPAELYEFPNCRFVADFIGKTNLFEASVSGVTNGRLQLDVQGLGRIVVPHERLATAETALAIRPEKVRLDREQPASGFIRLRGRVGEFAYYGDESHLFVDTESGVRIAANLSNYARTTTPVVSVGDELWVSWDFEDMLILTE